MKSEEKIKVCIFARVSSMDQSTDRQISDLTKIAHRNNWNISEIITEKISGAKTNEERDGLKQLLQGARDGKFQKVAVCEVSRLGRSTIETLKLVSELHSLNVSIYLQDLGIETLNEKGEMSMQTEIMIHMMSLFAKNERSNLILRIRSGMAEARKNGQHCGRYKGTEEKPEQFLAKYPKIVEGLKKGFSVRQCVKLYDTSLGTVAKIRKMILPELNMVA